MARGNEVRVADLQDLKARQPAQQNVEGYREYKVRSFSYSLRGKCCWFLAVDGRANRPVA